MIVLGIETSCDETAVALYDSQQGLLQHRIYTQSAMHAEYGGVVPELASRDHIQKLLPLIQVVLKDSGKTLQDLHGIAYTKGPGLVGALMVGAAFARSLGFALGIPVVGVHHLEAHFLAPMLEPEHPNFPFLALLVSGGHTMLVNVQRLGQYEILGESLDDAAGEALDKTAKLLGLPYPGGPHLEALAKQGKPRFNFPRPLVNRPTFDFSFSGLKTAAINTLAKEGDSAPTKADLALAFQAAVMETLVSKTRQALQKTKLDALVVAGGVSANQLLRQLMQTMCQELQVKLYFPRLEFCTDNAAMVAYTGCQRLLAGAHDDLTIEVLSRWPLSQLAI